MIKKMFKKAENSKTKEEKIEFDKVNSKYTSVRCVHAKEVVEFHLKIKNIRNIIYDIFSPNAAFHRQKQDTAR